MMRSHSVELGRPGTVPVNTLSEGRQQAGRTVVRIIALILVPFVVAAHVVWRDTAFTEEAGAYGGAIGALALASLAFIEPRQMPMLQMFLVKFYMAMGASVFFSPLLEGARGRIHLSSRSLEEAVLGALVFALAAALVGVFATGAFARFGEYLVEKRGPQQYGRLDTLLVRIWLVIGVFLQAFVMLTNKTTVLGGRLGLLPVVMSQPGLLLTLLAWDASQRPSSMAAPAIATAWAVLTLLGLSSGMIGLALMPAVVLIVLAWYLRGRVPIAPLLVGALVVVTLNSAKHQYRVLSWREGEVVGFAQRANNWATAIEHTYAEREQSALEGSANSVVSRLRTLPQVAQVMYWTPTRIPFEGLRQWWELPLEYVPRMFWPDKPMHRRAFNDRYTLTFQLQTAASAKYTAITLPAVADGYWRAGWPGVLLEGAILGLIIGFYRGIARSPTRTGAVLGVVAVAGLSADEHVMATVAGLPQNVLFTATLLVGLRLLPRAIRRMRGVGSAGAG